MTLKLEKDRPGDVPGHMGSRVATITGRTVNGKLIISIDPPTNNDDDDDDDGLDMPMLLLEAIAGAGDEGVRGVKTLYDKVKGKGTHKQQALRELIEEGSVRQIASGQAKVHTLTDAGLMALEQGGE